MSFSAEDLRSSSPAEQIRMMNGIFAAARGTIAMKTSGDHRITTHHMKEGEHARDGLKAMIAAAEKKPDPKKSAPKPNQPHAGGGMMGLAKSQVIGHTIAAGLGMLNPFMGGMAAIGFTMMDMSRGLNGAVHSGNKAGYSSIQKSKGHASFAEESDHARGVTQSNAKPGHFDYLAAKQQQQLATAKKMLGQVERKSSQVAGLAHSPKMNAMNEEVISFADLSDRQVNKMIEHGGKLSLAETGTVSHKAIKNFTQRHHAPSPMQQMALSMG